MAPQKAAASRSKAAAARAEKAKKPDRTFTFRGVKLAGPKELPGTIGFDLAQLQARADEGSDMEMVGGMFRILEGCLGAEQMAKVRTTIKGGMDDPWWQELSEALFGVYGTEAGE